MALGSESKIANAPSASLAGAEAEPSLAVRMRRLLKLEMERLRMKHSLGRGGAEIAAARSDLVDHVVAYTCRDIAASDPQAQADLARCAIVALGGYGRRELSPYSDIDLLFLHPGSVTPAVKTFVERALLALWDAGLTLGHGFRSVRECVALAREDLHARTALSEARLITGNTALFERLLLSVDVSLRASRSAQRGFLEQMSAEWRTRLERLDQAVCVIEPQLKEGHGGLRDLHTIVWVGHARYGTHGLSGLESAGLIEPDDYRALRQANDFLLRVRNEAHFLTGRKTDLLALDLQAELAERLGYRPRAGLLASELLMREYYRRATKLRDVCREFLETHLAAPPKKSFFPRFLRPRVRQGFELRDGLLYPRGKLAFKTGAAVLHAFEVAQTEGVGLSRELRQALRAAAPQVGGRFRRSRDAGATLLRLAGHRGRVASTLRALHDLGVLGSLLPEWARITFLVQHDYFHKYTVDEHTLRALDALDGVVAGQDAATTSMARIFDEIADTRPLYLGMLLHDIAKGRGGGHVEKGVAVVRRILARLGIGGDLAAKVVFLVAAHLEMSQIAQTRDLNEAEPIEAFAAKVETVERLNLLMLLTYADHCAVGPGTWNEWKASLLGNLYARTRRQLEAQRERGRPDPDLRERDRAAAELRQSFPAHDVERHFALLPERYLRATDAVRIQRHFDLLRSRGERVAAFQWADHGDGQGSELTITAEDHPGLFAQVAGTLSVQGIDILGADLFTRTDGVVLDTLRVAQLPGHRPVRPERRERLEAALLDALAGRVNAVEAFARWAQAQRKVRRPGGRAARPPVVRFDQEASALATVVEVRAPDQPGLAYTLAHTLAEMQLDILSARVATAKALAFDTFYVHDAQGRKLGSETMVAVEQALLAALSDQPGTRTNG